MSQKPDPVRSWAYYDFANSSYVLIFQSYLLPVFFSNYIGVDQNATLQSWGMVNGISTLMGVVLAMLSGKYADKTSRLSMLTLLTYCSFFFMMALSLSVALENKLVPILYMLTNIFFLAAVSISDSSLRFLSGAPKEVFQNSGRAWGFGYAGGILALIIVILLQKTFGEFSTIVFGFVSMFYILFSILSFRGLKNVKLNTDVTASEKPDLVISSKNTLLFLLGCWFISEAITVILLFYSIYASKELNLDATTIGATLLFVQLIAWPATKFGGKFCTKFGFIKSMGFSVIIWSFVVLLLTTKPEGSILQYATLSVIVALTGLVVGNTQSYMRAQFSLISQKSNAGFKFGQYALVSQAASMFGVWAYGYFSDYFGSQVIPLLALLISMWIGLVIITAAFYKTDRNNKLESP